MQNFFIFMFISVSVRGGVWRAFVSFLTFPVSLQPFRLTSFTFSEDPQRLRAHPFLFLSPFRSCVPFSAVDGNDGMTKATEPFLFHFCLV